MLKVVRRLEESEEHPERPVQTQTHMSGVKTKTYVIVMASMVIKVMS